MPIPDVTSRGPIGQRPAHPQACSGLCGRRTLAVVVAGSGREGTLAARQDRACCRRDDPCQDPVRRGHPGTARISAKAFRSIFRRSPLGRRPISLSSACSKRTVSCPTFRALLKRWMLARTAIEAWSLANHPAYRSKSDNGRCSVARSGLTAAHSLSKSSSLHPSQGTGVPSASEVTSTTSETVLSRMLHRHVPLVSTVRTEIPVSSWTPRSEVGPEQTAPATYREGPASRTNGLRVPAARCLHGGDSALSSKVAKNRLTHHFSGRGHGAGPLLVLQLQIITVVQLQDGACLDEARFTTPRPLAPDHAGSPTGDPAHFIAIAEGHLRCLRIYLGVGGRRHSVADCGSCLENVSESPGASGEGGVPRKLRLYATEWLANASFLQLRRLRLSCDLS